MGQMSSKNLEKVKELCSKQNILRTKIILFISSAHSLHADYETSYYHIYQF